MTNIDKYIQLYNMSLHEATKASEIFENLNFGYSTDIKVKAKAKGVILTGSTIRNIRYGNIKNHFIFNLLIELAKEEEVLKLQLQKSIEEIS